MKRYNSILLIVILMTISANAQKFTDTYSYPATTRENVIENYFDKSVEDPYRWLENDTATQVLGWMKAQNKLTNSYLDKIPFRNKIKQRLAELWNYERYGIPQKIGDNIIYTYNNGLQNQGVFMIQDLWDANTEVLLDPNKLSNDGTVAVSDISFSNNKKYMAYTVNKSGSDWQEIYVMNLETRKTLSDKIEWAKFTGVAWYKNGFYYSKYEKPAEGKEFSAKNQHHKVFYHELSTPQSQDKLVFENKNEPDAYYSAVVSEDERFLLIVGSKGTSGNNLIVKNLIENSDFKIIVDDFQNDHTFITNIGNNLILSTKLNAPNTKLITVSADNPFYTNWKILIPDTNPINAITTCGKYIFVNYNVDVKSKVVQYNLKGKRLRDIELPAVGTASGFSGSVQDNVSFFTVNSFLDPGNIYSLDTKNGKYKPFKTTKINFDFSQYETKQVFYESKDGTKIPMYIVMKKGLELNGKNPVFLYGYGGFDISVNPAFTAHRLLWLEQGGIYAQANLRGGSEYGQAWHEAGMLLNKQNVFDDFIYAAKYLIAEKYTSSDFLSIYGRSNGGLLIGACMTQHPELYRVAMPAVGVLDMLRYHKFTIGRAWGVEYGIADDNRKDFENLYRYSPLHTLKIGVRYPSTLVTTADHDDRVVPAHSFKFAARLQEVDNGTYPQLIRIDTKSGHGAGKPVSKLIDEWTDVYSFALFEMGVKYK